jgi:hypothetical protein
VTPRGRPLETLLRSSGGAHRSSLASLGSRRARRGDAAARLLHAALLGATLLGAAEARADILPEPSRPEEWRDAPAPMPEPPPEKELPALVLIAMAAATLAATSVFRLRGRTEAMHG